MGSLPHRVALGHGASSVPSPSLGSLLPGCPWLSLPHTQCGDSPAHTSGDGPCVWGHLPCHCTMAQLGAQSHPHGVPVTAGLAASATDPLWSTSPRLGLGERSTSRLRWGCPGCTGVSPPPWGHPGRSPPSPFSPREGASQQHHGQRSLGQKPGHLAGEWGTWGDKPPCLVAVEVGGMVALRPEQVPKPCPHMRNVPCSWGCWGWGW